MADFVWDTADNNPKGLAQPDYILDDEELQLILLSRQISLKQRCELLIRMYSIVESDKGL